jgi:hypothetical protein
LVTPQQTTTYYVTVSDGFNQVTGTVNVIVNPAPVVSLGPADTTVCIYDTLTLDAGNPGCSYYWSNGATTQSIHVETTGIGYDVQTYTVRVINAFACVDSATITVAFAFSACTGTEELPGVHRINIYPNPNDGHFRISVKDVSEKLDVTVESLAGQVVHTDIIPASPSGTTEKNIDLPLLPRGVYIVRVKGEGVMGVKKMIIF